MFPSSAGSLGACLALPAAFLAEGALPAPEGDGLAAAGVCGAAAVPVRVSCAGLLLSAASSLGLSGDEGNDGQEGGLRDKGPNTGVGAAGDEPHGPIVVEQVLEDADGQHVHPLALLATGAVGAGGKGRASLLRCFHGGALGRALGGHWAGTVGHCFGPPGQHLTSEANIRFLCNSSSR